MDLSAIKIDVGSVLSGIGTLARDLRAAITGKEPISADKAAEIALKVQELEAKVQETQISVMLAEASSQDKWTSRARPSFMYVMYCLILASLPMGIIYSVSPSVSADIIKGFAAWLDAIPNELYTLFGVGFLGYSGARSWEKVKLGEKK